MNDRFKFRVWDKSEESYFTQEDFTIYLEPDGRLQIIGTGVDGEDCFFETKDVVIEQCTGLKDKNGKLIYEGDILKCVHSDIMKYKIYWGRSCWRMKVYGSNNNIVDDTHLFLDTDILEVIGNIHENADLLGEDK